MKQSVLAKYQSNGLPHEEIAEPLSVSQENIWSNTYEPQEAMGPRLDFNTVTFDRIYLKKIYIYLSPLTAVKLEHQADGEVIQEAAVQYEGDQRCQSALAGWSRGFCSVGIHLTQS